MKFPKPLLPLIVPFIPVISVMAQAAEPGSLPAVGALVRVEAPRLGPGWHVGMLKRLRIEPRCHRVVTFPRGGSHPVTHTLWVEEIERMQTHHVHKGRHKVAPSRVLAGGKVCDEWVGVSMDASRASLLQCPS